MSWKHGKWPESCASPVAHAIATQPFAMGTVLSSSLGSSSFKLQIVLRFSYYNASDPALPVDFYCWPCRVVLGESDALLDPDREAEVIRVLDELGDLALFRRGELSLPAV